jgi:hypothetical protein
VPASVPAAAGLFLRGTIAVATYLAMLYVTGFFHSGEMRILREIRDRVPLRTRFTPAAPDRGGVEMAGEIVDAAPEPDAAALETRDATKPGAPGVRPGAGDPLR